jgi:hypothetical protein
MITPKEKAEELVLKFKEVSMGYGFNDAMWYIPSDVARLLALRCVDEILDAVTTIADKQYDYWQEVKQEIKLL